MPRTKAAPKSAASAPDPFAPQQELAPAANEAPVANDDARRAIATINTQLTEMDRVEAGLQALETRYAKVVYPVDTETGMTDAKAARKELKDTRVAVEHARKAAKAPVLDLGRNIDGKAETIKTRIQSLETPIDQQITVQETKEAERIAELERQVLDIVRTPAMCIGKTAAQLQEVLDGLNGLPLEPFAEYRERAAAAQESARQQVTLLLTQAKQAEELAVLRKQQQDEADRKAALQMRVTAIGECLSAPYRTSERVQQAIDRLAALAIGDDFAEFAPAAREKKAEVLAALTTLRDGFKTSEDAAAAARRAEQATKTHANGAPMFGQHVKENGDRIMLDDQGHRSVFCDVDEGEEVVRPSSIGATPAPTHVLLNTQGPMGMDSAPQASASLDSLSDHDRINDEGAQRLHAAVKVPAPHFRSADFDVVDAEIRQRPSDAEILALVASHFDVTWGEAAKWLRSMNFDAALAATETA